MYKHLQERDAARPTVKLSTMAEMKASGEKIACLTAYDASFAALIDRAGTDLVLVGDSLGMVIQGHDTTIPVTMNDMVYHCKAVHRGLARSFMVADMPFMTYTTRKCALDNAVRLMQEGGAKMVKLEGGATQVEIVEFLAARDIPVCAHIGLKPQSIHKIGGFKIQGRDAAAAKQMKRDAKDLENAGADILLLECIPQALGAEITAAAGAPVIGIGAGPNTDGQILVLYDILDVTLGRKPKFSENFADQAGSPEAAVAAYVKAVKDGNYPAAKHCF